MQGGGQFGGNFWHVRMSIRQSWNTSLCMWELKSCLVGTGIAQEVGMCPHGCGTGDGRRASLQQLLRARGDLRPGGCRLG